MCSGVLERMKPIMDRVKISKSVEIPVMTRCCFCIPLRKGLITMAYINLVLSGMVIPLLGHFIFTFEPKDTKDKFMLTPDEEYLLPQLIIEFVSLMIEFLMTVMFLVGLHMKKVILMRIYLYFGLVYMVFSAIYNVTLMCISKETTNEFIFIVSQLLVHIYFLVLVWSSIIKINRDGTVKYTRSEEEA